VEAPQWTMPAMSFATIPKLSNPPDSTFLRFVFFLSFLSSCSCLHVWWSLISVSLLVNLADFSPRLIPFSQSLGWWKE
jgi:hypothetical protein